VGHWRFRRSIGSKFLKLNISKTGFSITGGVPGAHVNADLSGRRKKAFMNTFGLPGTGLSYRTSSYGPSKGTNNYDSTTVILWIIGLVVLAYLVFGG
jgi:Protein of unknown function (DUF4236)